MKFAKGYTFGFFAPVNELYSDVSKESMKQLVERTGTDTIIFATGGLQDTPHSVKIDYDTNEFPSRESVVAMINYAQKELGLRVFLKPIVNCRNGVWRGHINFFDIDEPCETTWDQWFDTYNEFILHHAEIAEETGCEMLIIGCEMVQTDRKYDYWVNLINQVREKYNGLVSYNCDKYQEDNVKWWEHLDVISASGYYPINDWDQELDRIEEIVKRYNKPFFFAEAGCMSSTGSSHVPNNWELLGSVALDEQANYYKVMFEKCDKREFVNGYGLWDWKTNLNTLYKNGPEGDNTYHTYGKPAEMVIENYYKNNKVEKV